MPRAFFNRAPFRDEQWRPCLDANQKRFDMTPHIISHTDIVEATSGAEPGARWWILSDWTGPAPDDCSFAIIAVEIEQPRFELEIQVSGRARGEVVLGGPWMTRPGGLPEPVVIPSQVPFRILVSNRANVQLEGTVYLRTVRR